SVADLVYVRLSDGVGGGLVVGGQLVTGSSGLAGELGHVTVEPAGRPCRCGKRGCLETVASVPGILAACWEFGLRLENL
ncbi:ROK family protein, partial [Streptomyces sp. SID5914]